jgi:hypothetical protein
MIWTICPIITALRGVDICQLLPLRREAAHGEIGGGHSRPDNVSSGSYGTNPTYVLKRLMRDRPDLAESHLSLRTVRTIVGLNGTDRTTQKLRERLVLKRIR